MLHRLRVEVSVRMRQWMCSCGAQVFYDAAQDGLYSSTTRTVFTRTLIDLMTQMLFPWSQGTGHAVLLCAFGK